MHPSTIVLIMLGTLLTLGGVYGEVPASPAPQAQGALPQMLDITWRRASRCPKACRTIMSR